MDTISDVLSRDAKTTWHPYTPYPITDDRTVFDRASGAYVFSSDGKKYFDATSSWWCNIHGHCHPRLVEALHRQAQQLDQILFSPHTHPRAVELSEALLARLGPTFAKVFYSDDGSTAVEAALKMAVQYWHNRGEPRAKFLSLELGYHGDTLGAVSVSHVDVFHHYFNQIRMQVERVPAPYCYRCPVGKKLPQCDTTCLQQTERLLGEHGSEIAALIVEPLVLGAGGMLVYPAAFLEKLVEMCRRHGILVIFDEVFTGFGRTGTFFAFEQTKVRPDIVCLSKGLTSGMLPLAVTAVNAGVFAAFEGGPSKTFYHGHTFTANGLGVAVALESLKVFDEEGSLERVAAISRQLAAATPQFLDLPHVGEVRHLGGIWALELVTDKASRQIFTPANGPGWRVAKALWELGIWIRPLHNMMYLVPMYCSTESDLQATLSVLYSELRDERHFTP